MLDDDDDDDDVSGTWWVHVHGEQWEKRGVCLWQCRQLSSVYTGMPLPLTVRGLWYTCTHQLNFHFPSKTRSGKSPCGSLMGQLPPPPPKKKVNKPFQHLSFYDMHSDVSKSVFFCLKFFCLSKILLPPKIWFGCPSVWPGLIRLPQPGQLTIGE